MFKIPWILIMQFLSHWRLGFIERVYRVRVEGAIDQKLCDSIAWGLQKAWPYRPTAILVSVNSPGGSVVQAKGLADLLRLYSNRYNVPIVGFAEDQCLGSANLILTAGVRSYANSFSMIGDIGCHWSRLWYSRFAQRHNIKQEYVHAGENKVKLNPFEEIKPESKEWVENYIKGLNSDLTSALLNNRNSSFAKHNLGKEDIQREIFDSGIIDPSKAVELGLIDGVRNIDQQLRERYSTIPVRQINKVKKSWAQRLSHSL